MQNPFTHLMRRWTRRRTPKRRRPRAARLGGAERFEERVLLAAGGIGFEATAAAEVLELSAFESSGLAEDTNGGTAAGLAGGRADALEKFRDLAHQLEDVRSMAEMMEMFESGGMNALDPDQFGGGEDRPWSNMPGHGQDDGESKDPYGFGLVRGAGGDRSTPYDRIRDGGSSEEGGSGNAHDRRGWVTDGWVKSESRHTERNSDGSARSIVIERTYHDGSKLTYSNDGSSETVVVDNSGYDGPRGRDGYFSMADVEEAEAREQMNSDEGDQKGDGDGDGDASEETTSPTPDERDGLGSGFGSRDSGHGAEMWEALTGGGNPAVNPDPNGDGAGLMELRPRGFNELGEKPTQWDKVSQPGPGQDAATFHRAYNPLDRRPLINPDPSAAE